jgi:Delta3,5-Delta2,4-dienoyl-CoA isomerase
VDLITACDVRYCSDCARFSVKEVAVGLCADVGTLQRLPKCVGNDSWVRELAYTGRTPGAAEALQFGLVSKVCSGGRQGVLDAAISTANTIAKHSPLAVAGTKINLQWSQDHR